MPSLFLRRATTPADAIGPLAPSELSTHAPSGDDCIAFTPAGPFAPVDRELDRDGALRDALLVGYPLARASRYQRWKLVLFTGLVPVLTLAALDRDLVAAGYPGALASLAIDAAFAVACAIDLMRQHPRMPMVTAAAFASAGVRVLLVITSRCGDVHPLLFLVLAMGVVASVATVALSPRPRAVADHLRRALSLAPPTRLPPSSARGFYAYIGYAVASAAALPLLLLALRTLSVSISAQLLTFIVFALVVPHVGRVLVGKELPPLRMAVAQAAGISPRAFEPSFALSWRAIRRAAGAAAAMLVLSFAMVRGAQNLLDATAEALACSSEQPGQPSPLLRFIESERAEVAAEQHAPDLPSLLLTVAVVPVAEELVYRGLVQHALRKRVRRRLAIGLSALLFGLAHLLVYKTVAWQTVLLGLTFGLAYESAGLLASTLVHMLWNLWLSM